MDDVVECNPTTSSSPDHQQNQPRNGVYYGETSRSLHERALEHTKDAKAFVEGSHMVKHWMECHPFSVEQPGFKFTIIGAFKDCLSRQVAEAMRIYYSHDNLLNSKNEYLSNNIARVTVDIDKFERKKKELEEEKHALEASRMFEDFKLKNTVQYMRREVERRKTPTTRKQI